MDKFLSPQFKEALLRAVLGALFAAIPFFIAFLQSADFPAQYAAYGLFAARLLEGVYDAHRDKHGDVTPADVSGPGYTGVPGPGHVLN